MKKRILLPIATLAFTCATGTALAAEDSWYITGGGGVIAPTKVKAMDKFTGTYKKSFEDYKGNNGKVGPFLYLGGGYNITENCRAEGVLFYASPSYKKYDPSKKSEKTTDKKADDKGATKTDDAKSSLAYSGSSMGVMFNGYASYPFTDWVEGYFGAGVGFASSRGKFKVEHEGVKEDNEFKKSNFGFVWNLTAGLGFNVQDMFKVDVQYRYADFGTAKFASNKKPKKDSDKKDTDLDKVKKFGEPKSAHLKGHIFTIGFRKDL